MKNPSDPTCALIIIDCLRYDQKDQFHFDGTRLLSNVIAVSNWTVPTVSTMITGMHPFEHRMGALPNKDGLVNSLAKGQCRIDLSIPTLLHKNGAVAVVEIPMLYLLLPTRRVIRGRRIDKELAWEHVGAPFLILHFKGGHQRWWSEEARSIDDEEAAYIEELNFTRKNIAPLVKEVLRRYDRVVIAADHGREHRPYYRDHGVEFGLDILHTPVFYKRSDAYEVEDENALYDTRVIYDLLLGNDPVSRQVAISSSPAHRVYNRIALTYLHEGELAQDIITTTKGWDV